MPLYAITSFLSAALLFQVQLLMGKYLLPWFGGGAGVWTACLAFFQVGLLVGYLYVHLGSRLSARGQVVLHLVLVALSVGLLSIPPDDAWKPAAGDAPITGVLAILAGSIGLPFVVLSATAPLLQRWIDVERPWVLYAASNAGALVGLVSYPFVVEPALSRGAQATGWTWAYVAFAILVAVCAARRWRGAEVAAPTEAPAPPARPGVGRVALWILLPACSSASMLAVTNHLSQAVPPTPFLWVLPLAIHLATFVLVFSGESFYPRRIVAVLVAVGLVLYSGVLYDLPEEVDRFPQLVAGTFAGRVKVIAIGLFLLCTLCHGELYRLRPGAARLTGYYLAIAAGGAIGGAAVAIGAPLLLDRPVELPLAIVVSGLVLAGACVLAGGRSARPVAAGAAVLALGFAARVVDLEGKLRAGVVEQSRNFYGSLALYDLSPEDPEWHRLALVSGTIEHGHQFRRSEYAHLPTTYYTYSAGAGLAMQRFPRQTEMNVGVVGLGIGTVAAYGRPGDRFKFYEIDPDVIDMAREHFDYLDATEATVEVVVGDARLSLEREEPNGFDVLILDAFTADSIPIHLLTQECFELYLEHLAPDGVIALHVTNRSLDFGPMLATVARELELGALAVSSPKGVDLRGSASDWVLLTTNRQFLNDPVVRANAESPRGEGPLWTDEHASLFELIDWE